MGEPLANQLLEEAAQRTTELTTWAEENARSAESMVEHAQALGARAIDDAKTLHEGYLEAIAAVRQAADQSREAADAAGHALQALPGDARRTGTAVALLLGGVHDEIAQLGALRARLMNGVADSAQNAEAEFHALSQQVQELTTHLDARLAEAASHAEHLEQALGSAAEELGKVQETVAAALEELQTGASGAMGKMTHALEQMVAGVSHGIVDFCNAAIASHNELTAAVRNGYVGETKDNPDPAETWVEAAFQPVRDAIAELSLVPSSAQSVLGDALDAILDEGEKAVGSIDGVSRSLHAALPEAA